MSETLVAAKPANAQRAVQVKEGARVCNRNKHTLEAGAPSILSHPKIPVLAIQRCSSSIAGLLRRVIIAIPLQFKGLSSNLVCSELPKKEALNARTRSAGQSNLRRAFDALSPLVSLSSRNKAVLLDNLHLIHPFRPDLQPNRCLGPPDAPSSTYSDLQ